MSPKQQSLGWLALVIPLIVLGIGRWLSPDRADATLLLVSFFLLTMSLGGAVFLALTTVCGGRWHRRFTPIPSALARTVPITGLMHLVVLGICRSHFDWVPEHMLATFWFKELWLAPSFWIARSVTYVVVWSLLSLAVARSSLAARADMSSPASTWSVRISAIFLALFAVTFSLATVDWLMALEPMWFSTVWGVYGFAGMIEATLAIMILMGISPLMRRLSSSVSLDQAELHDLAQLLIGFSCFWMYIWFCQYMLIWYTNIPEETSHIALRVRTAWGPIVLMSIVLNWLVPFFALLPKSSKQSPRIMSRIAVIVLIGRWIDLSLIIYPSIVGEVPVVGIWEVAGVLALIWMGIFLFRHSSGPCKAVACGGPA